MEVENHERYEIKCMALTLHAFDQYHLGTFHYRLLQIDDVI